MTQLSIVTTLYKSEPYVQEFYDRTIKTLKKIEVSDYEFVFVDDGSPDNSLKIAVDLHKKNSKVNVIQLSRNFGHHKAIMTGLSYAKGDLVFLIDSDLEEEPELLEKFWTEFHRKENADTDVLYGVQKTRKGGWFERWSGALFYKFFNWLSGTNIPKNTLIAKLMKKEFKEALVSHKDKAVFLGGLVANTGFVQKHILCHKSSKSLTTYSFRIKLLQSMNSIISFSSKPLRYIFYSGFLVFLFSILWSLEIILKKIFFKIPIAGWSSIMIAILSLGGLTLSSLGLIGIYISKIFDEVKERPYTVIKFIWDKE